MIPAKRLARAVDIRRLNWDWKVHFQVGSSMQLANSAGEETSTPHPVDLPRGLLECPPDMAAAFPRVKDPRENKMEAAVSFVT